MKKKIGIIIQARMGSSRLPGKILRPFYGEKTLIEVLLSNLKKIDGVKIIVATSVNSNNDQLENFLKERNEIVYRGSENDVLERFICAAEDNNIDGIIRVCSDNPFLDHKSILTLIKKAENNNADYIGFRINGMPSIKTHFGFWAEYVSLGALKKVYSSTTEKQAHEHVTINIYSNPDEYICEWIKCPDFLQGRNDIRLTVDTLEDMAVAQKVYQDLIVQNSDFGLKEVVEYLDSHPVITLSMKRIMNQNKK